MAAMVWVISYRRRDETTGFVRWYKDHRKWVDRAHGKTATQYATREAAIADIPVGLSRPDVRLCSN
jgi:hypothetical protein